MVSDFLPQIDASKCIGCELCAKLCPTGSLTMIHSIAVIAAPEMCSYTGICQEICPTEAISLAYEIVVDKIRRKKEEDASKIIGNRQLM